ncbi:cysteine dioxygenase family protein [uncultured Winogradskyella sp.]|uniref:cysteine dioxygenase n=1 Tax=uncultured Winogradskyella sp. TaxID=395353 RepID=UPI00261F4975|nr:cysteine dioxygenase family protein [uncultured Winogradskyella sp.]
MNTQKHIKLLIDLLSESSNEDYTQILKDFDFDGIDFSEIEHWIPNCYSRNCFYRDSNFELILICWDKGQQTAIHDHDGEECWVYLLDGEMNEEYYKLDNQGQLTLTHSQTLCKNQITKSDKKSGFHRLRNTTFSCSMSLHVYAKPIAKNRTFDEQLGCIVENTLVDHTFSCIVDLEVVN